MNSRQQLAITTVHGVKSIPISQYPAEAWTSLIGSSSSAGMYELYDKVPWLYRGINTITEAIVGLPRNNDDLKAANIRVDWNHLLNEIVGDWLFFGAMYCVLEENRYGNNQELRRFHPSTIRLATDKRLGLLGFNRQLGAHQTFYKRDQLGFTWIPSRKDELSIGTAPVKAALNAAGLLASIDEYGVAYFDSGAINPTIARIEEFETYPQAEQDRTKSKLEKLFDRGNSGAHKVAPVGANITFETVGSPMKDLAVPELTDKKREDISTALGIPQSLLFSSAANFATARQDDQHFYSKTVIPLARKIEGMLNPYFLHMGLGVKLSFREQEMELFQRDESNRSDSLNNLVAVGIPLVTAMEILGFDLTEEQWAEVRQAETLPPAENLPTVTVSSVGDDEGQGDEPIALRTFRPVESIVDHLDMWRRKATKAFRKQGNAEVEFVSELIPPSLKAAIEGHLAEVQHRDDISHIFDNSIVLIDPHTHDGLKVY
jgi:HK97 family phage portal protein